MFLHQRHCILVWHPSLCIADDLELQLEKIGVILNDRHPVLGKPIEQLQTLVQKKWGSDLFVKNFSQPLYTQSAKHDLSKWSWAASLRQTFDCEGCEYEIRQAVGQVWSTTPELSLVAAIIWKILRSCYRLLAESRENGPDGVKKVLLRHQCFHSPEDFPCLANINPAR